MLRAMLSLDRVSKLFDGKHVLRELSLEIPPQTTTVLVGSSGCGKSTILRLVLGLLRPDRGEIRFQDQPLASLDVIQLRQQVGYVVQSGALFPHLTARENVALLARELGWASDRILSRLDELRELTQLPVDALDRYPLQLSGGQRQRVALMRALFLDPDLLLLDEPLSALDPMIRYDLQDQLKSIFQSLRKTVVVVTHDLAEAAWFADQIVLLDQGTVAQTGTFTDLSERPESEFVRNFVRAQRDRRLDSDAGGAA